MSKSAISPFIINFIEKLILTNDTNRTTSNVAASYKLIVSTEVFLGFLKKSGIRWFDWLEANLKGLLGFVPIKIKIVF